MLAGKLFRSERVIHAGEQLYVRLDAGLTPLLYHATIKLLELSIRGLIRFAGQLGRLLLKLGGAFRLGVQWLWNVCGGVYTHLIQPLVFRSRQFLWLVWHNPMVSLLATLGALALAYAVRGIEMELMGLRS